MKFSPGRKVGQHRYHWGTEGYPGIAGFLYDPEFLCIRTNRLPGVPLPSLLSRLDGVSSSGPGVSDGSQPFPQGGSACTHFFQWVSRSDLMDIPGLMTHQHGIFLLLLG